MIAQFVFHPLSIEARKLGFNLPIVTKDSFRSLLETPFFQELFKATSLITDDQQAQQVASDIAEVTESPLYQNPNNWGEENPNLGKFVDLIIEQSKRTYNLTEDEVTALEWGTNLTYWLLRYRAEQDRLSLL